MGVRPVPCCPTRVGSGSSTVLYLLHQAVARAAHSTPEREAVCMVGTSLTYGDLERQSNQLARVLIEIGIRRGDRVGIYAHKSPHVAVAIHGIMKAGAAYVPLNPDAPLTQLVKIVSDCDIRCVCSEPSKAAMLARMARATTLRWVVGLDEMADGSVTCIGWSEIGRARTDTPAAMMITEQDLAYVLYTSGSTGHPKGIAHSHRSALSFAEIAAMTYGFHGEDRISNHAPLHFDLSTLDYFSTAVAGATTVIIPERHTKFPASLSELMATERLTVLYAVPFALIQLLLRGALASRDLGALRWVLFGGEPFPTKHLRELMRLLPQARFSNVYGPTETNGCTYHVVPSLDDGSDQPIPIGTTYANVEALVVDADDRPVGVGGTGELLIRSPTRMLGYWRQPAMTTAATFRRPAPGGDDDLFHRTGDLVELLADGGFRLLGRKDRQVKTRGYRVELDEIEAMLAAHPGVEEAAAYAVPDGEGSQRIEAMATLRDDDAATERPTDADLTAHLRGHLPRYAIPTRIAIAEEFPRTTTGKIDRRQLREWALNRADDAAHPSVLS